MKRNLFVVILLMLVGAAVSQTPIFGISTSYQDTVAMTSAAADSVQSRVIMYSSPRELTGEASLFATAYSNSDGLSDAVIIRYRLLHAFTNLGDTLWGQWTVLDSITTTEQATTRYGSGAQSGKVIDVADKADPWQAHLGVEFEFYWAPSASDTAEITANYTALRQRDKY